MNSFSFDFEGEAWFIGQAPEEGDVHASSANALANVAQLGQGLVVEQVAVGDDDSLSPSLGARMKSTLAIVVASISTMLLNWQ